MKNAKLYLFLDGKNKIIRKTITWNTSLGFLCVVQHARATACCTIQYLYTQSHILEFQGKRRESLSLTLRRKGRKDFRTSSQVFLRLLLLPSIAPFCNFKSVRKLRIRKTQKTATNGTIAQYTFTDPHQKVFHVRTNTYPWALPPPSPSPASAASACCLTFLNSSIFFFFITSRESKNQKSRSSITVSDVSV